VTTGVDGDGAMDGRKQCPGQGWGGFWVNSQGWIIVA